MWFYSLLEEDVQEAGLEMIETYIITNQKTTSQYIATSPILELYLAVERHPGLQVPKWWLEQE